MPRRVSRKMATHFFVNALADLSGAAVAASVNSTGAHALGGDWNLEYSVGGVHARAPFSREAMQGYGHTLSHFRGGSITWQAVELDNDGLKNDVQITAKTAWRYNSVAGVTLSTSPQISMTQLSTTILYVNGNASLADYGLRTSIFEAHNLDPNTHYLVTFSNCCRISTLLNNADGTWNIQSDIYMAGGNLAPKLDLPIVFQIPQFQSDGTTPPDELDIRYQFERSECRQAALSARQS